MVALSSGAESLVLNGLLCVILLVATVSNSLLLFVFYRRPGLRTISNRFVINLLVTNLITCWILLPSMLADNVWRRAAAAENGGEQQAQGQPQSRSALPCLLLEGAAVGLCVACVLSVVMIGVDQYFAVIDPLRYHAFIKAATSVLMMAVSWTLAAAFAVLGAVSANRGCAWYACERLPVAESGWPLRLPGSYPPLFAALFVAFAFVAPFGAICWIYLSICSAARQNHKRATRHGSAASCGLATATGQEEALLDYACGRRMGKHKKLKKKEVERLIQAVKELTRRKRKRSSSEESSSSSDESSEERNSSDEQESSEERESSSRSPVQSSRKSSEAVTNSKNVTAVDLSMKKRTATKTVNITTPTPESEGVEETGDVSTEVSETVRGLFGHSRVEQTLLAPAIDDSLASIWKEVVLLGLPEVDRKALADKYPTMENCNFLEPPIVNEIVRDAVGTAAIERDDRLVAKQKRFKFCIAGIAKALSPLIHTKDDADLQQVETLCDVGRGLADGFYEENAIRRHLLIQSVNETWRKTLRETVSGEFLFGPKLEDKLIAAKALAKSIEELKPKKPVVQPKNVSVPPRRFLPQKTGGGQLQKTQKPAPPPPYNRQKTNYKPRDSRSHSRSYRNNNDRRKYSHDRRGQSSRR